MQRSNVDRERIRAWVANLADLVSEGRAGIEAEALAITAEMLLRDPFPASAFTADAMHAVVQDHAHFPPYATIRRRLGEWWNENRPALAPPAQLDGEVDLTGLSPLEISWVQFFGRRQGDGFAATRPGDRPSSEANCLSAIQQHSPKAYAAIMRSRGHVEERRDPPSDADRERVRGMVRPDYVEPVERPLVQPRPVSPEVLAKARRDAGIVGPHIPAHIPERETGPPEGDGDVEYADVAPPWERDE